ITNFGTVGISAISDGTGGAFRLTKRSTNNTSIGGYERNRLDMQKNAFQLSCNTPAVGQTYLQMVFEVDISPSKIHGVTACLSFLAKSYTSGGVLLTGTIVSPSGINTAGDTDVLVASDDNFYRYFIHFRVGPMPLGASLDSPEKVLVNINLPVGKVFDVDLASLVFTIGDIAYPLTACY
ncbi:TPA: hypothetical protein N3A33_004424, partial [Salmonella enterica subsp. salamae serovar 28:r:e,n,z15]|nr:hypothetical protein [Salmonella enterica subsp. salamae serovar 28:r:e,n,z15]